MFGVIEPLKNYFFISVILTFWAYFFLNLRTFDLLIEIFAVVVIFFVIIYIVLGSKLFRWLAFFVCRVGLYLQFLSDLRVIFRGLLELIKVKIALFAIILQYKWFLLFVLFLLRSLLFQLRLRFFMMISCSSY